MGKAKYPKYKSSKTLWQEQIPSHWQETELRMLFADNKNKNIGLVERNLLSLSYGKLKRKDIDNATGLVPASFEGYQIIDKEYIVLRFTDLQNDKKSLRVGYANEKGIITNAYIGLAPKTDIHSKYFYYQLHFLDKIKYFYNLGGGVRQSLAFKEFGRETILVPEKKEQVKIADFLDYKLAKIERFILKKKKLIQLLNERKASIINKAVIKGLDNNCSTRDSNIEWIGEIPKHWDIRKLSSIISSSELGGNYNCSERNEGIPVMKMGNLDRGKIKLNKIEYLEPGELYDRKHLLNERDFLFNTRNSADLVGKVSLWRNELPTSLYNSNILKIVFKDGISNEYMNYLFNSKSILNVLKLISKGTTNVSAIYYKDLSKIDICVPNFEEQKLIADFLKNEENKIEITISKIEKEIALTEEYKTSIIAEAVTGKIDVREYNLPSIQEEEEAFEDLEEEMNIAAEEEAEYKKQEME